jgi:hypothetical protein
MVVLHLTALVQECWLTVSFFLEALFLGLVPSLEGPS